MLQRARGGQEPREGHGRGPAQLPPAQQDAPRRLLPALTLSGAVNKQANKQVQVGGAERTPKASSWLCPEPRCRQPGTYAATARAGCPLLAGAFSRPQAGTWWEAGESQRGTAGPLRHTTAISLAPTHPCARQKHLQERVLCWPSCLGTWGWTWPCRGPRTLRSSSAVGGCPGKSSGHSASSHRAAARAWWPHRPRGCSPGPSPTARSGPARLHCAGAAACPARHGLAGNGTAQTDWQARHGLDRAGKLGSARHGMARHGTTRLGTAQLGWALQNAAAPGRAAPAGPGAGPGRPLQHRGQRQH